MTGTVKNMTVDERSEMRIRNNRLRRQRQLRRRITLVSLCAAFALFTGIFISASTRADASITSSDGTKYYHSVIVQSGDGLWSIARDNYEPGYYATTGAYLNEIMEINHVDRDTMIHPGDSIIVPYHR